jgi:hypothetical protein
MFLADFLNSSSLKPLGQMIRNLVGSIYGRSSIKSTHFVPIPLTSKAATGDGLFGHAVSEEKIFRNRPIRNKNRLWWPCLLMDRDGMSNLRGPSIDASYQVSASLKPLGQMIRNLVGSIYGRSSIKSTHFVPIPLTSKAATGDSCF